MKPSPQRRLGLGVSLLLLVLAGCARLPVAPVGQSPQISSATELWQHLQAQAAAVTSLKGRGTVAVTSPEKNYSGNILVTAAAPTQLRVDVLNFWGQSLLSFLTEGEEMKLLVYGDSRVYRGPATPANLSRFIPLAVSLEDFVALLAGHLAYRNYEKPVLLENSEPTVYLLEVTGKDKQEKANLTVARENLQILSIQWFAPTGAETMRADFSNFLESRGIIGPTEIHLAASDREHALRVRLRELVYNAPITASIFALPETGAWRETALPQ